MTIRLSVAIMHASFSAERRAMVSDLCRKLEDEGVDTEAVSFEIVKDLGRHGPWHTARRAWMRGLGVGSTHHLVLQDDVVLCDDFFAAAKRAILARPNDVVSFYANRQEVEAAREKKRCWAILPESCWGQALCFPTPMISDFLRWNLQHVDPTHPHDDDRVVLYLLSLGRFVWYALPSLVDHVGDGRSLMGHGGRVPQRARWFVGRDRSAAGLQFTSGAEVQLPDAGKAFQRYLAKWTKGLRVRPRGPGER